MQHRIALKHLRGSRANTVDHLALPPEREITFGRDPECHVRYNEADELVSRRHLKIVATDEQPVRYMVVDLGSSNGTFVDRQRVYGAVALLPGGRVQLGPDGPEFEFRLGTEEAQRASPARGIHRGRSRTGRVGRAWKRRLTTGALMMLLLAAAGAAGYATRNQAALLWRDWGILKTGTESKAGFTATAALASVASIETEWNVFEKQTGALLSRAYIVNERSSRAARVSLVEGAPATVPAFVLAADRRIEPLLVPAGTVHAGQAVGGKWSSRGVIVSERGAVLTAAPGRRPWETAHLWAAEEPAGALLVLESGKITQVVPLAAAQFPRWVPAESGFFAARLPADLQGDIRGRRVSANDLRVGVTAGISASGRSLKAKVTAEEAGIWLVAAQPGVALAGVRIPQLENGATRPKNGLPVWVVGNEIEAGEVQDTPEDDLLKLRVSSCGEGGVVFDQDGRALALCIPDAHSDAGAGVALPIRRGLVLLNRAPNGKPWQP